MTIIHRRGKNFMEQIEISKQSSDKSGEVSAAIAKPLESRENVILPSQNGSTTSGAEVQPVKTGCSGVQLNGGEAYPYVYTLGRIMARFPSKGIEISLRDMPMINRFACHGLTSANSHCPRANIYARR